MQNSVVIIKTGVINDPLGRPTDENNDHYRLSLWFGLVDQLSYD